MVITFTGFLAGASVDAGTKIRGGSEILFLSLSLERNYIFPKRGRKKKVPMEDG